ncbi:MAG TPA: hydrogenase maturation protease [Blastocatellia bacterium]|nr:hydrogenase maturation protease [Blastocatellia bacterium]
MTPQRILIACIGNIFLGDDAFGVEVARLLAARPQPEGVTVVDYGIRGLDLAYAILDGYDVTIFVDATPRGGEPGTLYLIEPDLDALNDEDAMSPEAHSMSPVNVLRLVRTMGGTFGRIMLVGCEPEPLDPEGDGKMGLSAPVRAALGEAVSMIEDLVAKLGNETAANVGV